MPLKPMFLATGIGSVPFDNPAQAVELIISTLKEAPHWPQLPQVGFREQMEVQFSGHMPCAVMDHQNRRLYFDTSGDYSESFAQFYENFLAAMEPGAGDFSQMAVNREFAAGLHAMRDKLEKDKMPLPFLKCQIVGPCTFCLTVTDENKRAIYYNEEFRDVIAKALAMAACWQVQTFKPYAKQVLCFIDEPILSAFGSSTYVGVQRADVVGLIAETIAAVRLAGGVTGVHCCGNTEWSILVDAGVDIINFDAFEYGETLLMYAESIKMHLLRGGVLAWGIVPTSAAVREQTVESLAERLENLMDALAAYGIGKRLITEQAMITPACGTGSMNPADATMVYDRLAELSDFMKKRYDYQSQA